MQSKELLRLAFALTAWDALLVVGLTCLPSAGSWDAALTVAAVLLGLLAFGYWCDWAHAGAAEGGKWATRAERIRKALAHEG